MQTIDHLIGVHAHERMGGTLALRFAGVLGLENGKGQPDQKALSAISRVLNVHLSGSQIGQPKFGPKNKDKAPANKK